jgi:hypothetical protein
MWAREVPCAPATLTMITKKKLPMRAIFFRDHEISGLWPCLLLRAGRPAAVG